MDQSGTQWMALIWAPIVRVSGIYQGHSPEQSSGCYHYLVHEVSPQCVAAALEKQKSLAIQKVNRWMKRGTRSKPRPEFELVHWWDVLLVLHLIWPGSSESMFAAQEPMP